MSLFQLGHFRLHSGKESDWKIDCDFLTTEDLETLAYLVSKSIYFREVIGVPTGGLQFASALEKYKTENSNVTLIVDDVFTTGKSMQEYYAKNPSDTKLGVVIFSRGDYPAWITPIFQLDRYL